jgi:hypothetical protein
MRKWLLAGLCIMAALCLLSHSLLLSEHADAQVRVGVSVQHAPLGGKVVIRQRTALSGFAQPVLMPPRLMPSPLAGSAWRWHRNYGWIALPEGGAPATILLPETFALPPQVQTYEVPPTTAGQLYCPHCGQVIVLMAR